METNPHRWIAALRHSQDRLASLVQPLSPEQLRGPTYHSWTIAETLSHMGSQAELFMDWLTAAVQRTDPPGQESMQAVWGAWDARSPEAQAADSLDLNERLVQRFEALTDDELAFMHLDLFGMELDAANLARLRVAEHALHTWDIAVALDPAARVSGDAVALLVDTLSLVAHYSGKPQGKTFRLHVRTSDPECHLLLQVSDAVTLSDWSDVPVDGELRLPAEAFVRLVYGRLDPDHSPKVEITADGVTLDDLRQVFQGV